MAHLIIENARVYILILCKVLVEVFFFLPFFYVSPPRVYLSLRFKRNRLKIFGHLIAVYTCMLGENHQKNRTMARFRLNIKKKQKYTPHSGKQECVSIYIKAIPTCVYVYNEKAK